jgi:hypothetical protein
MLSGVRTQAVRLVIAALVVAALIVGGCGAPASTAATKVDLPAGSSPVALAADGDGLLIGVRRDGQPLVPGLLRLTDGVTEVPVHGASPYGLLATWQSIAVDNGTIVAIGGERGGAHGNVRWSVWTGSAAGVTERPQGFSTFGGWGAGDLIDAVITPVGPALVGSWESERVGLDVAVWTADGDTWSRRSSAGTALQSDQAALGFATAATSLGQGTLIAGWQMADKLMPVVWQSSATGWTKSPLPDAGRTGTAMAVRCWASACGVAGQVDGKLAVWRLVDGTWARLSGVPEIPVGDKDRLPAPIEVDGKLTQFVSDGGRIKAVRIDSEVSVREVSGPTGMVTTATGVGDDVFLLAGPDASSLALWRLG